VNQKTSLFIFQISPSKSTNFRYYWYSYPWEYLQPHSYNVSYLAWVCASTLSCETCVQWEFQCCIPTNI